MMREQVEPQKASKKCTTVCAPCDNTSGPVCRTPLLLASSQARVSRHISYERAD